MASDRPEPELHERIIASSHRRWRVTLVPETDLEGFAPLEFALTLPAGIGEDTFAWWLATMIGDFDAMAPKMAEYGGTEEGSADLQIMGNALAELCGMHDAPDAVKQEMACWFYALGKISRLVSDYKQNSRGKDDTWHDLTVYSMMARRLQEAGRWP